MNIRLDQKYLRIVVQFDFSPNQRPKLYFETVKVISLDEYLDNLNDEKKLKKQGYRNIVLKSRKNEL